MGSNNARQVTLHGGWLKPNAYKLLQVMAWRSYDDPVPQEIVEQAQAKGEPVPVPNKYYARLETSYTEAFGKPFPARPTRKREEWTEADEAQERKYQAARQAVKDAFTPLLQAAVAERVREGRKGQHTAAYLLHLHRLIDKSPVGNSYQAWEEIPTTSGRKSLPNKADGVGNSYPSWEEKPTPEEQTNSHPLKNSSGKFQAAKNKRDAPQATTVPLRNAHASDALPASTMNDSEEYEHASTFLQGLPDVGQTHMETVNATMPDAPIRQRVIAAARAAGWKSAEMKEAS